jgi:hypothetical protein
MSNQIQHIPQGLYFECIERILTSEIIDSRIWKNTYSEKALYYPADLRPNYTHLPDQKVIHKFTEN